MGPLMVRAVLRAIGLVVRVALRLVEQLPEAGAPSAPADEVPTAPLGPKAAPRRVQVARPRQRQNGQPK